jgi:hypothetical protein
MIKYKFKYEDIMGEIVGGNIVGGVGNLVFYSYNDNNYVRTAPGKRSKKSWTEKQHKNWNRFSALIASWRLFRFGPIKQIWRVAEEGKNSTACSKKPMLQRSGLMARWLIRKDYTFQQGGWLCLIFLRQATYPAIPIRLKGMAV